MQAHRLQRDAQERQRKTRVLGEPKLRVDVQALVRHRVLLQLLDRVALARELGARLVEVVRDLVVDLHPLAVASLGGVRANDEIHAVDQRMRPRVGPVDRRAAVATVRLDARAHHHKPEVRHEIGVLRDVERDRLVERLRARNHRNGLETARNQIGRHGVLLIQVFACLLRLGRRRKSTRNHFHGFRTPQIFRDFVDFIAKGATPFSFWLTHVFLQPLCFFKKNQKNNTKSGKNGQKAILWATQSAGRGCC